MSTIYKKLMKLSLRIDDPNIKASIIRLADDVSKKNRKVLKIDVSEMESLVNPDAVEYRNEIGEVIID